MSFSSWRKPLNAFIQLANDQYPGIYTSHSFRINLVTRFLRTVPLIEVSHIVGHKDANTTARYFRFRPKGPPVKKEAIQKALEDDHEESE